uniref:Protein kibra n=2 Tax=Cacopsylla melanoneura TaxID=428564 RepID=A0A8D9EJL6_9HEMI
MMAVFCLDNSASNDREAELCQVLEEIELSPDHEDEEPGPVVCEDKQTNTECVFVQGGAKSRGGHSSANQHAASLGNKSIVIKRSQTFSPVARNSYICRLNRSESDSSMPLYRRTHSFSLVNNNAPFRRNSVERRSLRWHRTIGTGSVRCKSHHTSGPRTSLDLELDLRAQHTKLQSLQDELQSLRNLKSRLETAKEKNDVEVATWVLEDAQFQNLISQADGKSADDKKVEKLLKKTSREIYKLRKHKAGKGKPDLISFKEKMAFFTRTNNTVPLPPSPLANDPSPTQERQRFEYTVDRNLGVEV